MALRKEKIQSVRKQLIRRREIIAKELRQATVDLINDEAQYSDTVDQSSADSDKTLNLYIKNNQRGVLSQIDLALRRMDEGSFGECERCNDAIADARIKAFPFTTLCIDCKAELESEGQRYPGRVQ